MINKVDSSIPLTADDTAFLVAALASPILKMPLQPWVQETATSTMDEKIRRLRELHDALFSLVYS